MLAKFLKFEAASGIVLGISALLALIINNSPLSSFYVHFFDLEIIIKIGEFVIDKPLFLWVNDGLMAIFFFLVGLELKREMIEGQLSSAKKIMLPILAALGGVVMPAVIYSYLNWHNPVFLKGWAIPAATDIAFALGIISLLGSRVPNALKVTLVAIAIIDDLAAIMIIALFYTNELSVLSLSFAGVMCLILFLLNQKNVISKAPYIVVGIILWACVLKSGVHATLAGVVLAFSIPLRIEGVSHSPSKNIEKDLHPWVAYGVLPLFAFANAGVSLKGVAFDALYHPVTLGIILGLFIGKQLGVMLMTFIAYSLRISELPAHVNWGQYYGMALLTGVGFTMSLFVGGLSFEDQVLQTDMRIGVLLGSTLSGIFGYFLLKNRCSIHK